MADDHSTSYNRPGLDIPAFNRRRLLGAGAAVAGAAAFASRAPAANAAQSDATSDDARNAIRVAAISFTPPFHDHRRAGVNLQAVREMTAKAAIERPNFVCFPEACTCVGQGFEKGIETAPELDAHVEAMAKIAREFDTALIVPFLERSEGRVYNSVPIVDRRGKLALVYRKNYPTITELEAGVSPGREVPVAECDGVRVGAAVCFDANFDHVAVELERQRARLVFWPSMYWGGALLQHWALRYGFAMVAAYVAESSIIDMSGRVLARQGADTFQVRRGHLPPWAVADVALNRELYHLDYNQDQLPAIREKYAADVDLEIMEPEGFFLMASRRADCPVEAIAAEFGLETLRDYLARSVQLRDRRLE